MVRVELFIVCRIAVHANDLSFTGLLDATGGLAVVAAQTLGSGPGTIYLDFNHR